MLTQSEREALEQELRRVRNSIWDYPDDSPEADALQNRIYAIKAALFGTPLRTVESERAREAAEAEAEAAMQARVRSTAEFIALHPGMAAAFR